jgi:threonine 3-dehydrogenase
MGADVTFNATKEDVVNEIKQATGGRGVDVVVDFSGNAKAIQEGFTILRKGGRFTMVGLPDGAVALDLTDAIIYKELTVLGVTGRLMYETWWQCNDLLKSGKIDIKPVIGGVYPLKDYELAFDALQKGAPGKMLLIP